MNRSSFQNECCLALNKRAHAQAPNSLAEIYFNSSMFYRMDALFSPILCLYQIPFLVGAASSRLTVSIPEMILAKQGSPS